MELVLASRNRGKLKELSSALAGLPVKVLSLDGVNFRGELREPGPGYRENALSKAEAVARATGLWALADDSGLEVEALDFGPGPESARLLPPGKGDSERNQKILELLREVPLQKRKALFRCTLALVSPSGEAHFCEGTLEGVIATEPRGSAGFGYDPIFLLPEYGRTLSELGPTVKGRLSHRARALSELRGVIERILKALPRAEGLEMGKGRC